MTMCGTCGGKGKLRINVNDPQWEPGPLRTRRCPDCEPDIQPSQEQIRTFKEQDRCSKRICVDTVVDLEDENARLQARVEEVTKRGVWLWHYTWKRHLFMLGAEVARTDRAEALTELRGEALNNVWGLHHGFSHKGHLNRESCPATSCQEARAAIAATPEEDE